MVDKMLDEGANVSNLDDADRSCVWWAINLKQSLILERLLSKKPDLDQIHGDRLTPLTFAVRVGSLAVLKCLLHSGPNPNKKDQNEDAPILIATRLGSLDSVKLLIEFGADPNISDREQRTALWWAVDGGDEDKVMGLLEKGADPNARDLKGCAPIFLAAKGGMTKLVKLLLEKGSDPNIESFDGHTPLSSCASNKYLGCTEVLLENMGAFDSVEIARNATQRRRSVALEEPFYETMISLFAKHDQAEIVAELFDFVKYNFRNSTLISRVIITSYNSTASHLLENGGGPNLTEEESGYSPINGALKRKNKALVKQLIETGAKVNPWEQMEVLRILNDRGSLCTSLIPRM